MHVAGIGRSPWAFGCGALGLLAWMGAAAPVAAQQRPPSPAQQRPTGSITAYCGGGVTGGGGGTRIQADGTVTRLDQPRAGVPVVLSPLGTDREAHRRWTAALGAAGFARLAEHRPGNFSCSLTQEFDGRLVGVAWPGAAPPSRIPEPVRRVFTELRSWSPPQ
jgi:hypothetical protein